MNNLNYYIQEKLKINSKSKINQYKYNFYPKNNYELRDIIETLLKKR